MGEKIWMETNASEKSRHTKKNRNRRAEISFFFLTCVRIVKSSRLSSFSFICRLVTIFFFFF